MKKVRTIISHSQKNKRKSISPSVPQVKLVLDKKKLLDATIISSFHHSYATILSTLIK